MDEHDGFGEQAPTSGTLTKGRACVVWWSGAATGAAAGIGHYQPAGDGCVVLGPPPWEGKVWDRHAAEGWDGMGWRVGEGRAGHGEAELGPGSVRAA